MVYKVVDDYPEDEFDDIVETSKRDKKKSFIKKVLPWKRRMHKDEAKATEGMSVSLVGVLGLLGGIAVLQNVASFYILDTIYTMPVEFDNGMKRCLFGLMSTRCR